MARGVASPEFDIESRRPVWSALSDLFLDTSFIETDINRIAHTLASSRYTIDELEQILLWEVYPACHINLLSIAGEWLGFDPEWLEARILRGPWIIGLASARTVGRVGMSAFPSWRAIKRRVEEMRSIRS